MAENSGNGKISWRTEAAITMALNENKLRKAGVHAYSIEVTRINKNVSKIIYKKEVSLQSGISSAKQNPTL